MSRRSPRTPRAPSRHQAPIETVLEACRLWLARHAERTEALRRYEDREDLAAEISARLDALSDQQDKTLRQLGGLMSENLSAAAAKLDVALTCLEPLDCGEDVWALIDSVRRDLRHGAFG